MKKTGASLNIELAASKNSPVHNPAFVINNWSNQEVQLKINGKTINRGKDFRLGFEYDVNGKTHLIVWIKKQSNKTIKLSLEPI